MNQTLTGKRIAFLATDGVEQSELEQPWNEIRKAGAEVELLSVHEGKIQALRHMEKGDTFDVDGLVADADPSDYDGLVLPGGGHNGFAAYARAYYYNLILHFFGAGDARERQALAVHVDSGT